MSVLATVGGEVELRQQLANDEKQKVDRQQELRRRALDALSTARVAADPHGLVAMKVKRAEELICNHHYQRAIHVLRSGAGC